MKATSFHRAPLWASCLLLGACDLLHAESPETAEAEPAPATSTEVTVTRTEPEPLPEPATPSEPPPPPPEVARDGVRETDEQTRGRLPPAKINAVLAAHGPSFNQCYAKALAANPGLAGTVTLVIVISPEGSVPHAEVVDERSTLDNVEVHACLVSEAKTLQFDKPVGGRVVTHYPLEFKPAP
ncbi:MAG TPA: AgmX/PglI C-terminal domain-containing protein [Polyangiaceae bacterium]